ncbi:hypothetical protein KvSKV_09775 [Ketogulonicigenium vulgare]|nr:hypothetical protein KVH_09830 [Ketogulonicigenium vulgare]ANW34165.1 hypothetical protein KvSKV_09775 [Ketogulonicigenium vulgare]
MNSPVVIGPAYAKLMKQNAIHIENASQRSSRCLLRIWGFRKYETVAPGGGDATVLWQPAMGGGGAGCGSTGLSREEERELREMFALALSIWLLACFVSALA